MAAGREATPAPDSGQYRPVGPRGGSAGSNEITAVQGKPLPPTPKAGQSWQLSRQDQAQGLKSAPGEPATAASGLTFPETEMRYLKLQKPPRERVRVRDLAKEVGLTSQDLVALLAKLGEHVKSPASMLESPVIRRIYGVLGVEPVVEMPPPASTEASRPQPSGLAPPTKKSGRENNPLMPVAARVRDKADPERPRPASPAPTISPPRPITWHSDSDEEAWARGAEPDASHAFEYEEWKLHGFTPTERDIWIAAGLRFGQAKRAFELRGAGLAPCDLQEQLHGWTVAERLRRGEGVAAVTRLLRAARKSTWEQGGT
jgi:hypothetical protein